MAVTWKPKPPEGKLVADRHLYLDSTQNKVVEHGDESAAFLLAGQGSVIDQAQADRLGLVAGKDGKVTQDHEVKIEDLQGVYDGLLAEQKAFAEVVDEYKTSNAVKDIPNTMELERVELEAKVEAARLTLSQAIKTAAGKDASKGESQASATEPDRDERKPKKGKGK
jgi:hypothetical protein